MKRVRLRGGLLLFFVVFGASRFVSLIFVVDGRVLLYAEQTEFASDVGHP